MQTRRDQLQAYQFLVRRILAALLGNEPEAPEQPMRRAKAATFSGIMLGALVCGGVALTGFLTEGSSATWKETEGLIVNKDTGQHYLYKKIHGRKALIPIINYPSVQLLLGDEEAKGGTEVSPENLAGVPKEPAIGIPGIPTELPNADNVTDGPWLICNHMPQPDRRLVELFVDHEPQQGSQPLGNRALLVEDETGGQLFLIWNGHRLALDETTQIRLGLQRVEPIRVRNAWLNTIPRGSDLQPIEIANVGAAADVTVKGQPVVVGQVLESVNSDDPYWLVYEDGVAPITETQANLIVKDPAIAGATNQTTFTRIGDVDLPRQTATDPAIPEDQPDELPRAAELESDRAPLCLTYKGDPDQPLALHYGGTMPASISQDGDGTPTGAPADRVTVTGGEAAVISTLGADGKSSGFAVVADSGLKYPVPDRQALALLGYDGAPKVELPKVIADLIRAGPALDPTKVGLAAN